MAVKTIEWKNDRVVMLDQRLLPHKEVYRVYRDYQRVAEAIRSMVIRGAPAIGVAAAMGVAVGCSKRRRKTSIASSSGYFGVGENPTHRRQSFLGPRTHAQGVHRKPRPGVEAVQRALREEAQKIFQEDIAANKQLGKFGAGLLRDARQVMTHCNAGALATAGYGTALGVIRALKESGKQFEVWVNETRPFLQGRGLTAWELKKEKIPATLITDNMAGYMMQKGKVDAVVVGCDRVAANGDVAEQDRNLYCLPCLPSAMVFASMLQDRRRRLISIVRSGEDIPIEQRDPKEVSHIFGKPVAPKGIKIFNPAFDVTLAGIDLGDHH